MVGNKSQGRGFAGVAKYVLGKDQALRLECGTLAGATPRELAREVAPIRAARRDLRSPVVHRSLSLAEGERLTPAQWSAVATEYMARMGFENSPWFAAVHGDSGCQHVHLVALRVDPTRRDQRGRMATVSDSWDYRRSAEILQDIERRYELARGAMAPGQAQELDQRQPASRALQAAVATSILPAKARLQDIIDAAIEASRGDREAWRDLLEASGVQVKENVKAGQVAGISFELDGYAAKGSQLGKAYTARALDARLEARHGQAQAAGRGASAERGAGENPEAWRNARHAGPDGPAPGEARGLGQSRPRPGAAAEGRGPAPDGSGRDASGRADGLGREIGARGLADSGLVDETGRTAGRPSPDFGRAHGDDPRLEQAASLVGRGSERAASSDRGDHDTERPTPRPTFGPSGGESEKRGRPIEPSEVSRDGDGVFGTSGGESGRPGRGLGQEDQVLEIAPGHDFDLGGADRGVNRSGGDEMARWDERFRRAATARRRESAAEARPGDVERLGQGDDENGTQARPRVPEQVTQTARAVDPTPYLESRGYAVRREGRHLSVRDAQGDEVYRGTVKPDGHYVFCDRWGQGIGDNIALVRHEEPETKFANAVYRLHGGQDLSPAGQATPLGVAPQARGVNLPKPSSADIERGRAYLRRRGISAETIQEAEKQGMLAFGRQGVLFVGRDAQMRPRAAYSRSVDPLATTPKRDLAGSCKSFAPILVGDPDKLIVVEGGVDGLAAWDWHRATGQKPPSVIVSGGAGVRSWATASQMRSILTQAKKVIVARDREKDAETQERTNLAHDRQASTIRQVAPQAEVTFYDPQFQSDLADEWKLVQERQREQLAKREREALESRREDLDQGRSHRM